MLPVICSMFEFTKEETEKMDAARKTFNQEKIKEEINVKSKKLFGNIGKKFGKMG